MEPGGEWEMDNGERVRSGDEAEHVVRRSVAAGTFDITFSSAEGDKRLQFLTSADEGVFAVDPDASGQTQSGYRLANGQLDTYSDNDTVTFAAGVDALRHMVENDVLHPRLSWRSWT